MKIQFAALESFVNEKRPSVNAQLYAAPKSGPSIKRFRIRSKGESEALIALVLAKKQRAVQEGTFVSKEAGKIYFDVY
ncbi:hypothetical protein RG959_00110 [Domibacillus sp. 8LH]|uniref:hypothetical protein n=1 Tax=Domibacillus sp. 8LH TaxID=3073900 RepID=UPI00317C7189